MTVISKNADGELKVSGDLTIRGVTRNVVFDVEDHVAHGVDISSTGVSADLALGQFPVHIDP